MVLASRRLLTREETIAAAIAAALAALLLWIAPPGVVTDSTVPNGAWRWRL